MDLKKAFDTIWLKGSLYKLMKKNFPRFSSSYEAHMTESSLITASGETLSKIKFQINNGQQGTVNLPVSFKISIAELKDIRSI